MANIEKIEVRIEREETKLKSYLQRKQELEIQIQTTKKKIEDLKADAKTHKLGHMDGIASEYDITPEDIELALVTGDYSIIDEKRRKALEAKKALETTENSADVFESAGNDNAEENSEQF